MNRYDMALGKKEKGEKKPPLLRKSIKRAPALGEPVVVGTLSDVRGRRPGGYIRPSLSHDVNNYSPRSRLLTIRGPNGFAMAFMRSNIRAEYSGSNAITLYLPGNAARSLAEDLGIRPQEPVRGDFPEEE